MSICSPRRTAVRVRKRTLLHAAKPSTRSWATSLSKRSLRSSFAKDKGFGAQPGRRPPSQPVVSPFLRRQHPSRSRIHPPKDHLRRTPVPLQRHHRGRQVSQHRAPLPLLGCPQLLRLLLSQEPQSCARPAAARLPLQQAKSTTFVHTVAARFATEQHVPPNPAFEPTAHGKLWSAAQRERWASE